MGTVTLPFTLINAFTDTLSGGNPAAIVFVPSLTSVSDPDLQSIAANFNQPIAAFISPSPTPPTTRQHSDSSVPPTEAGLGAAANVESTEAEFGIRWFTPSIEAGLCGHGSLASAHAIFTHDPPLVPPSTASIKFTSPKGQVVVVKRTDGGMLELTLESGAPMVEMEGEEAARFREVIGRAVGKDVRINWVGKSTKASFKHYGVADLDVEDLAAVDVDVKVLTESTFGINVLTSSSATLGAKFATRMFAPRFGVHEDPVCGSAHCLVGPYWTDKKGLRGAFMARMASKRGGNLRVTVRDESLSPEHIKLAGTLRTVMKGELFL